MINKKIKFYKICRQVEQNLWGFSIPLKSFQIKALKGSLSIKIFFQKNRRQFQKLVTFKDKIINGYLKLNLLEKYINSLKNLKQIYIYYINLIRFNYNLILKTQNNFKLLALKAKELSILKAQIELLSILEKNSSLLNKKHLNLLKQSNKLKDNLNFNSLNLLEKINLNNVNFNLFKLKYIRVYNICELFVLKFINSVLTSYKVLLKLIKLIKRSKKRRFSSRKTDYSILLTEKQKFKKFYSNISEKQFIKLYKTAIKQKGKISHNLIALLESRLDTVLYRSNLAPTIIKARQLISHKSVKLNGKEVNIASILVKPGDVIELTLPTNYVSNLKAKQFYWEGPKYLEINYNLLKLTFIRKPKASEIRYPVQIKPNLLIEYYR